MSHPPRSLPSGRAPHQVRPVLLLDRLRRVPRRGRRHGHGPDGPWSRCTSRPRAINTALAGDAAIVRAFVNDGLAAERPHGGRRIRLRGGAAGRAAGALLAPGNAGMRRLEIRDPSGTVRLTSAGRGAGGPRDRGAGRTDPSPLPRVVRHREGSSTRRSATAARSCAPSSRLLDEAGETRAVVGDVARRRADPRPARPTSGATCASSRSTAALIAGALLFLIFRSAQSRISARPTSSSTRPRRDPLTGRSTTARSSPPRGRDRARPRDGSPLGVALIDIDNFRLLNDNHGHDAGDEALLAVVEQLAASAARRDVVLGRYGPDEFLLIAPARAVADLEPAVDRVRDRARRPEPPVRGDRAAAGDDQRRPRDLPRATASR